MNIAGPHCHLPNPNRHGNPCHCAMIGSSWETGPVLVDPTSLGRPVLRLRACGFCNRVYDPLDEKEKVRHSFLITHGEFMGKDAYWEMVKEYRARTATPTVEETLEDIRKTRRTVRAINMVEGALNRMEDDNLVEGEIGWGEKDE